MEIGYWLLTVHQEKRAIVAFILSLAIFFSAVVIHEFAHGLVAFWLGDKTAKYAGRLTLNPLAHIDPVGTIFLPILLMISKSPVVFGWAKPVPINYWGLRNPKRDILWVGLAGPLSNILIAFLLSLVIKSLSLPLILLYLAKQAILVNLVLAVFNLMPIPPLDGSRVVISLLPVSLTSKYASIERYGFIILFALLYFGFFERVIYPIVKIILAFMNLS